MNPMNNRDRCSKIIQEKRLFKKCRFQAALLAVVLVCNVRPVWSQNASVRPQFPPVTSLADSLKRPGDTQLHIFYVHGMAADGPGYSDSAVLRKSICNYLKNCTTPAGQLDGREYADKDKFTLNTMPPPMSYLGEPIWKSRDSGSSEEGWNASAPFVDHWKIMRHGGSTIYVDEINWWPLVFAAKCREIIAKDASLVGPSAAYIDKCATTKPDPDPKNKGRFQSYSWIEQAEAERLEGMPARGALINRSLKNSVLDWGFSDAVLAAGPMRDLLLEGIRQLVLKSVNVAADGSRGDLVVPSPNQEFVIVSHSLGSYLIFSALDFDLTASDASPMRAWKTEFENILGRTSRVYFFANQLRLLELANLDVKTSSSMVDHLEAWGQLRHKYLISRTSSTQNDLSTPAILAWSDPSDLLSWNVPKMNSVVVTNLSVKNSIHWLWLFESPTGAHSNYASNKSVLRVIFGLSKPIETK
jgi:hypothetical protein